MVEMGHAVHMFDRGKVIDGSLTGGVIHTDRESCP